MAEPTNSMAALMQILSLFQGKNQTEESSGTTTTKTTSQEGLNAMLKQALESNQGLASVMGGEKAAGLYNSSTNALLSNDLTSRLAAQIAANNSTTTTSPSTKTISSPAAINSKNGPALAGVLAGGTALNKIMGAEGNDTISKLLGLTKIATNKDAQTLAGKGYDKAAEWISSATADAAQGTIGQFGLGNPAEGISYGMDTPASIGSFDIGNSGSGLQELMSAGSTPTDTGAAIMQAFPTSDTSSMDAFTQLLGEGSGLAQQAGEMAAPVVADAVDTGAAAVGDVASNFPTASVNGTTTSTLAPSSSGNVESVAEAAPSTVINSLTTDSASVGASSFSDAGMSPDLATDATSAYYGSDLVDAEIPLDQIDLGIEAADYTSAYNAADGTSAVTAADLGGSYTGIGSAGSGSVLGYVGPIMSALNAPKNPDGAQGTDYRNAVGGAVLNYFGLGFLTPIANATATPILDAAGDAGQEALGNAGIVASDPVGALISGRMDLGDVVTSGLDPANLLGGNEGGSVGATVAVGVDPVGAALGGEGLFGGVSDAVNSVDSAISSALGSIGGGGGGGGGGRVVCTELALAGHISAAKYQAVLAPGITLTGRILLGYHILGIPAVRKLRRDPAFVSRALPYVNAYLDHKLGHWNLKGFLIKNIGEPLCYLLSFFNTDPEAYKTLYPYRRNRNGT